MPGGQYRAADQAGPDDSGRIISPALVSAGGHGTRRDAGSTGPKWGAGNSFRLCMCTSMQASWKWIGNGVSAHCCGRMGKRLWETTSFNHGYKCAFACVPPSTRSLVSVLYVSPTHADDWWPKAWPPTQARIFSAASSRHVQRSFNLGRCI